MVVRELAAKFCLSDTTVRRRLITAGVKPLAKQKKIKGPDGKTRFFDDYSLKDATPVLRIPSKKRQPTA